MNLTLLNLILILFGAVSIIFPNVIWKIKGIGRYSKDEEATPFMLLVIRIAGILVFIAGFFL